MKALPLLAAGVGVLAVGFATYFGLAAPSLTGFSAKMMCSTVFVAGRAPAEAFASDIAPVNPLVRFVRTDVDERRGEVVATVMGFARMRAVHRADGGCALADDATPGVPRHARPQDTTWPTAIDARVQQVVESELRRRAGTRALVVIKDGRLVAEAYAGADPDAPALGWSMSKSVLNTLAGRLYDRALLDPRAEIPEGSWTVGPEKVTFAHLLTMTAGLPGDDNVDPLSPLVRMTFRSRDVARSAAENRAVAVPGRAWAYSNADTNLLSGALKQVAPDAYSALARDFFADVGMRSAVFETDESNTYVGASFVYASPRDWARFGQMLLDDGVVGDRRVLSQRWIDWSRTPSRQSNGEYGALFWTNGGDVTSHRKWPDAPADTFAATGQFGQLTGIIPSRRIVIVRMGLSTDWDFDRDPSTLIGTVLRSME